MTIHPALMSRDGGGSGARFHGGDAAAHRALHFLEGELLERYRIVGQSARLENAPLPVVEHGERFAQGFLAVVRFLALGEPGFLVRSVIDQPVLPLAAVPVLPDGRVWRA